METRLEKPLLGKTIQIVISDVDEILVEGISEKIYVEALRLEKIFNIYDAKSELSELNRKRKLSCSEELLEVIEFGLSLSKITKGTYDISLGKKILAQKAKQKIPLVNCSYKDIEIKNKKIILKNKDVLIDLGSIAKGYIVDKLINYIKEELGLKNGFVNARGDIGFFGEQEREVLIEHPREKNKFLGKVLIKNLGIATSGDYKQYNENYDNSHIIGKREIVLSSVIDKSVMIADGLATCVMVCSSEHRKKIINKFKKSKFLLVDNKLKIKCYNKFKIK